MSNWDYKKKYLLNDMLFPILISSFFAISGVLLTIYVGLKVGGIIMLFGFLLLGLMIMPLFTCSYSEKDLTLVEFKTVAFNIFDCIFYDEEKQKAIRFFYSDNPCHRLEENKRYTVVMEIKSRKIMELIKPSDLAPASFVGMKQLEVSKLKEKTGYTTNVEDVNMGIVFPKEEIVQPVGTVSKTTTFIVKLITCVFASAFAAIGGWILYLTLVGRCTPAIIGFLFGGAFFLAPLSVVISTIKSS